MLAYMCTRYVPVAFFMYFLHLLFLTVLWYFVYILQMTKQPVSCSLLLSKHKVSPLFRYNLVPSLSNSDSVYLWLIHVDVWQKPSQYCKVITFQLKQIKFKKNYISLLDLVKVGPLNVVLLKVLNMSLLLVNLVVLVLFVRNKAQRLWISSLPLTRGPHILRVMGRFQWTRSGKVEVRFSALVLAENIHVKESFPNITE